MPMAYDMPGGAEAHRLALEGREKLTVSGVEDVERFDDQCIVLRTGADLRLRCTGCGHEVMKPRFQILPRVRSVERGEKQG